MTRTGRKALKLSLEEVLGVEFIKELLALEEIKDDTPRGKILHSKRAATMVRDKTLSHFQEVLGRTPKLSDLLVYTRSALQEKTGIGAKALIWLEEYLHLLGVSLAGTVQHGLSQGARDFLSSRRKS